MINNELKEDKKKSEIVLGLIAPVGVDLQSFEDLFKAILPNYRYDANIVKLSDFLKLPEGIEISNVVIDKSSEYHRYESLMDAGNAIRKKQDTAFLANVGISKIAVSREKDDNGNPQSFKAKIHIIHSIKHKDEVEILREVYGSGFFLVGIYCNKRDRVSFLQQKGMSEEEAIRLIIRDNKENEKYGQQISKVFELSDVFINLQINNLDKTSLEIERFLNLIFGNPFITPTRDENAMFLAYSASLRSGSLARQIGAVITNKDGDVVATGSNDVPRYGGGQYWTNEDDSRDFQRGFDANTRQRNQILLELLKKIYDNQAFLLEDEKTKLKAPDNDDFLELSKKVFEGTTLFDLTEFGRDVHAEMEAILCCVRVGTCIKDGTLYCTTFPCHNCAKHIIDSGIKRVVYVEAYPKSKAKELHSDSIAFEENQNNKVVFEQFIGIGARRYFDMFSMTLGIGLPKERKDDDGNKLDWIKSNSYPRVQMLPTSYIEREERIADKVKKSLKENNNVENGK